jgi:hypothetical protein
MGRIARHSTRRGVSERRIMNSWNSYPSIYNIGHRAVTSLLTAPVNVEEKVDGSQFSFCLTEDGELRVRSKGAVMVTDAPEKMFTRAVETVKAIQDKLTPGWTYRAEYLMKPKHNTLCYERIPVGHLIVFDVATGEECYLGYDAKKAETERIGLECVPLLFSGMVQDIQQFRAFLETPSVLGGQKVEGVVVKPRDYQLFGVDKKVLLGKFVSEAFKEAHGKEWKVSNPNNGDILQTVAARYITSARWTKAVQHLRESGGLEDSPRDIGMLMKEVPNDIEKECREEIMQALWEWAWPSIRRMTTRGLPEWYKEELLKRQFETEAVS